MILVHGAWGGAWCWRDLTHQLDERHQAWLAVDLPSSRHGAPATTSLYDDADEVVQTSRFAESVVLVAHSYGGAVALEAASRIPNLERIVFVAALVPNVGHTPTQASRETKVRTLLDDAIEVDGDYLRLNPNRAPLALYNTCGPSIAQWATEHLSSQTIASFRSPRTATQLHLPTTYVRCNDDRAMDPTLQDVFASRCDRVVSIESDHSPMLSQPAALAALLLD